MPAAFTAAPRRKKKLTSITKSNAQVYGMGLWDDVFHSVKQEFPDEVAHLSVWSRLDGVVNPRACLDPAARHREVRSSHCGMAWNRDVFRTVAQELAPVAVREQHPEAHVRLDVVRRPPKNRLEFPRRAVAVPHPIQRKAQAMPYSLASPRRAKAVVITASSAAKRMSANSACTSPRPAVAPLSIAMMGRSIAGKYAARLW